MKLIKADDVKEMLESYRYHSFNLDDALHVIDEATPVKAYPFEQVIELIEVNHHLTQEKEKVIELFNKYDILLVHRDGKIVPVKNSTKQECYNLLYDIQELIEWRKLLFQKHMRSIDNGEQ